MKQCCTCKQEKTEECFGKLKYTKDGLSKFCKSCSKVRYEKNKERIIERSSQWQKDNRKRVNLKNKLWRDNNKDKVRQYYENWKIKNPGLKLKQSSEWKSNNKDKVNANTAHRRSIKKNATVEWADKKKIRLLYKEAMQKTKDTGVRWEVDHIYPLRSNWVCGLHVENNLQVLTSEDNKFKSNKRMVVYHG